MQGGENEEDMPLPGSLPAELPNGRVPKLESSKGWGRLALPGKSKPKPLKPTVVCICLCSSHHTTCPPLPLSCAKLF